MFITLPTSRSICVLWISLTNMAGNFVNLKDLFNKQKFEILKILAGEDFIKINILTPVLEPEGCRDLFDSK
jgi:hypothetical protein